MNLRIKKDIKWKIDFEKRKMATELFKKCSKKVWKKVRGSEILCQK